MAGKPSKPNFLWQAILILLPVAVLSVIGWASLRQDKVLAENDAKARAQSIAEQLLPVLETELTTFPDGDLSNHVVFRVDARGRLIYPPPCDPAPAPAPFLPSELSTEQARLWAASQNVAPVGPADAATACGRFIDSNPPDRFAAVAQYQLGILSLQQKNWSDALKSFEAVISQYPDALGESGLPLTPLAQLKMIELQPSSRDLASPQYKVNVSRGLAERNGMTLPDIWVDQKYFIPVDSFCSNVVNHPTLLTPFLLGQVEAIQTNQTVGKWRRVWDEHERARDLFAAAREHLPANSPGSFFSIGTNKTEMTPIPGYWTFWFAPPEHPRLFVAAGDSGQVVATDENWIATRANEGTNDTAYICRPESELGWRISRAAEHVPSYLGIGVEVVGKRIVAGAPPLKCWHSEYVQGLKAGGQYWGKKYSGRDSTNLLASATLPGEQLKVGVYLTNPDELFASQRSRVMLFGSLVIASMLVALVGLFAASRAFHRQLRLAEMKSNFVSSVSHELRAPIASVRLMAESLERGKVAGGEKQNEYFRFIVQECRRLSSLIENVLDFSRIEQGRKQYEFEPTDLLALTRETVKLMEPYAEEKGVKLETSNLEPRTPNVEVEVDGRAIQQALVNLMDNAIKHSAKGQVVTVGLDDGQSAPGVPPDSTVQTTMAKDLNRERNSGTAGMPVRLYVEDHGAGIPPAEHEKIFERFYRLGSELRRETQGVGIGLSIVRHIVEAHGGKATVRSNVGEGSRFTIELPGVNAKTPRNEDAKEG